MPQRYRPSSITLPYAHRLATLADHSRWKDMRVGLYGGSFNPGHAGHTHIALEALKRLKLDAVWLMVSPGNPLKDGTDMASFDARLESARDLADAHPRLFASDIEARLNSALTAETLSRLRQALHRTEFIWLMGADNLAQFHLWHAYDHIARQMPLAVVDRPGYTSSALHGVFAKRYAARRVPASRLLEPRQGLPRWSFLFLPRHPQSASNIRDEIGLSWAEEG